MEILKTITGILLAPLFMAAGWAGVLPNQQLDVSPVIKDQVQQAVDENFGAFNVTGGGTYRLKASIGSTDTTVNLTSFKEPISDIPYTMSYINTSIGYGTLSPQTTRSEFISFTGITQNANGTAQLTGVSRGLSRTPQGSGCTASTTLAQKHAGQSTFILSDSPCLFAEYAVKNNDETITGSWVVPTPTASGNPTTKAYVDAIVNGGTVSTDAVIVAATAGETVASGQLVYFNRYEAEWKLTDADVASTTNGVMLGVAQGAGTDGAGINGGVILKGLDTKNPGGTNGSVIYLSNTAGATSTSAGTTERAIGIMRSNTTFYFDPTFSVPNLQLSTGKIDSNLISTTTLGLDQFAGNGSDGSLTCTSGTTYIDLLGATTTVKQYSDISITGTCAIGFINAANNGVATTGSAVIFKVKNGATITSSATRAIDVRSLGAYAGSGGSGNATGTIAYKGDSWLSTPWHGMPGGPGLTAGSGSGLGADEATTTPFSNSSSNASGIFKYVWGAGGGGGGGGCANGGSGGTGGVGGHGGGAFKLQVGGALNFTGTIDASGIAGTAGSASSGNGTGGGGGGGGGGGSIHIEYNVLTADTGTLTTTGGSGGSGGGSTSPGTCYGGNGGSGGASATSTLPTTKSTDSTATSGSAGSNGVYFIGKRVN